MKNEWSEAEFQKEVESLAKSLGWKFYHTRDSRKSKEGFPDLVMWRERVVFAELKKQGGRPSAAQETTIEELLAAGAEVHLWEPSDLEVIIKILK